MSHAIKLLHNPNTYARPNQKTHKIEVEFVLDAVPGAWHQPEDLMQWITQHSYVKCVRLLSDE